jgi:hypothetical protein
MPASEELTIRFMLKEINPRRRVYVEIPKPLNIAPTPRV